MARKQPSWRVAASLGARGTDGLLGEVNRGAPQRSRASDGAFGDAAHGARPSDHNPCLCCRVVCARDFTHDPEHGFDGEVFAEWLRGRVLAGEQRVKYVIWNRRIFSGQGERHPLGVWRSYSGKSPHVDHVHVSVGHGAHVYDAPSPWGWPPRKPPPGGTAA